MTNEYKDYINADEDNDEPSQEDSQDFENEAAGMGQDLQRDEVEGTKNFNQAYDKLIQKFYHEEGANLLIPQEDMAMHEFKRENKVKVDVNERQRRIREAQERKEQKILDALREKEAKEMAECTFEPSIIRKKKRL